MCSLQIEYLIPTYQCSNILLCINQLIEPQWSSFIDSDFKLHLNKLKFSQTSDLFHVYYYVIISSTKFMVIATNHMAMEAFWNYTLIH